MTNSLRFPSLLNPNKYGYTLQKDWDELWQQVRRNPLRYLSDRCGMFETYGDGMVQHAPTLAANIDVFEDYCWSLCQYLMCNQQYFDFAHSVLGNAFRERPRMREQIVFFMGLKYDENKRRFFSTDSDSYLKTSTSDSKRYDKRWQEVPSTADGSANFVWTMLCKEDASLVSDALHCYAGYDQFRAIFTSAGGWVPKYTYQFLDLPRDCDLAFNALSRTIGAAENLHYVRRWMESLSDRIAQTPREVAVD